MRANDLWESWKIHEGKKASRKLMIYVNFNVFDTFIVY